MGGGLGGTTGDAARRAVPADVPGAGANDLLLVAGAALDVVPYLGEALLYRRLGVLLSNPTGEELLLGEDALLVLLRFGGGSQAVSAFRLLTVAGSDLPTPGAADPGPVS